MANTNSDPIWTRTFALLCLAQFFGYAQQFLLTPTFPLYVTYLGGSPFVVGLVLSSFAVTSVMLRPIIGYWADRWSEAGVLVSGSLLQGVCVLFCFIPVAEASMLANGLRGIGWAGLNTGGYSLLAVNAPLERRGEASGYYTGVQNSATIFFPAIALWLLDAPLGGFRTVFLVAVALGAAGAAAGLLLKRTTPHPNRATQLGTSGSWRSEFFNLLEREMRLPAALIFCLQFSIPAVSGFIVLYAKEIGVGSMGSYFVICGVISLLGRPLLGRVSDKIGWGRSVVAGFTLQIAALVLLVAVSNLTGILIAGVLYTLGAAIGGATILAFAVERANPERRGRSLASFSVSFPLSYGLGSFFTGTAVELTGYFWTFLLLAAIGVLGPVLAFANWSEMK